MNKRLFNSEQIADLLRNPNVVKCSPKSISYQPTFKIKAVEQYEHEGLSAREIFIEAGFDLNTIGKDTPSWRIKEWREIYMAKGKTGLADGRGKDTSILKGRPKSKWSSDSERIKYLEAKVAYLQAENDFLTRLRSGKTE